MSLSTFKALNGLVRSQKNDTVWQVRRAKLARGVEWICFASSDRMERSILWSVLMMAVGFLFPLHFGQGCVLCLPFNQCGSLTHTPSVICSPIDGISAQGISAICKSAESVGSLALCKSCKQRSWILINHFLYRLLIFLSFVLAFLYVARDGVVPTYSATWTIWNVTWVRQFANFVLKSNQT